MNTITFRPATKTDLPILLEFEQAIVSAERPFNPTLKAEGVSYYDLADLIQREDAQVIVGMMDNKIITSGYAQIKPASANFKFTSFANLGFMYVDPAYRGKGINRLLIKELTNWAKAQGVYEIQLFVYSGNKSAIRAYEKVGFQELLMEMRLDLS